MKLLNTLRNNWKKTIFFTGVGAFVVKYGKGKYDDSLVRGEFCRKAKEYGDQPIVTGQRARKVTVFLNPAAKKGKAKDLFQKNIAPLLHLAGLEVTLVKTEYEGQAKKYMDVIEDTDAFIVAGGDGTLLEVVTGLLRREDQAKISKVPIGVLPLGFTNTLPKKLFSHTGSDVRWMAETAMAIITGTSRPADVMKIVGNEGKEVYAVSSLVWGPHQEASTKKDKYWYFAGLKHRWVYVRSTLFRDWPPNQKAYLTYQNACDGCSKCYTAPKPPSWKWWHLFIAPRVEKPSKDYSDVENPDCGKEYEQNLRAMEVRAESNQQGEKTTEHSISLTIGKESLSKKEFIQEGWQREKGNPSGIDEKTLHVQKFRLEPKLAEVKEHLGEESWFSIDKEQYEAMPIDVTLLKDKIQVFCPNNEQS